MDVVDVFGGVGGLALGFQRAGFQCTLTIERDALACETMHTNRHLLGVHEIVEADVREMSWSSYRPPAVLVGGPPCQPFSQGGKHQGRFDDRDMVPEFVRAVRELRPKAFVMENVRGLTRSKFQPYLENVLNAFSDEGYEVKWRVLNAADYGVPQHRERLFVIGLREGRPLLPSPTHSQKALTRAKWVTGAYWDHHGLEPKEPENPAEVARVRDQLWLVPDKTKPWRTVRDVLSGLPDPRCARGPQGHDFRSGAKVYPGHTGSPIDEPSKTLKAGVHGVPGGENMLRHRDGSVRYYTSREAARIQTFPDDYRFPHSWSRNMRQIGNSVPPVLSQRIAEQLKKQLTAS